MSIYLAGAEYKKLYAAGQEFSALQIRGQSYLDSGTPDSPGILTVDVTRRSRGATVNYSIADPDGIRAVTAVIMVAGDDTRSDVTSAITRSDANRFSGVSVRSNNKWRVASITITYVDATSGTSHTLTRSWSI